MRAHAWMMAEDVLKLPHEDSRCELIEGALVREPLAGWGHSALGVRLASRLMIHADAARLGRVTMADGGYLLARLPDTVVAPDVAFVSQVRVEAAGHIAGFWPGAPDLAAEIRSPSQSRRDMLRRADLLLGAGTRLVWILDPESRSATVCAPAIPPVHLGPDGTLDGADVVRVSDTP